MYKLTAAPLALIAMSGLDTVTCQSIFDTYNSNDNFGFLDDYSQIGNPLDPSPLFTIDDEKNFGLNNPKA